MKRRYLILLICILPLAGFGQYLPQFSQLIKTLELVNPGYNATKDYASLVVLYRNQWVGFEGAPKSYVLNAHLPINKWHLGTDLNLFSETIGLSIQNHYDLSVNTDLKISQASFLTFGLSGGVETCQVDWSKAYSPGGVITESDKYDRKSFHSAAGLNFFSSGLHLGASMHFTQLNGSYVSNDERYAFYFNGSYLLPFASDWSIKPAAMLRHYAGYWDFDYGLFLLYHDLVWAGISHRVGHALIFMLDLKVSKFFRIGYSFDYGIRPISDVRTNSHEFRLEFNLPRKKQPFERYIPD